MTDAKEMAEDLAGDFIEFANEVISMPLKDHLKLGEGRDVMQVYAAAEAARSIFTLAYQVHHKLTAVANNLKIEEVG